MKTQTLDLNKMGLVPMQNCEMQEVDGGGFLWELAKKLGLEAAAEGLKFLGRQMVADWKSRSGNHLTMTDNYISNPYH